MLGERKFQLLITSLEVAAFKKFPNCISPDTALDIIRSFSKDPKPLPPKPKQSFWPWSKQLPEPEPVQEQYVDCLSPQDYQYIRKTIESSVGRICRKKFGNDEHKCSNYCNDLVRSVELEGLKRILQSFKTIYIDLDKNRQSLF